MEKRSNREVEGAQERPGRTPLGSRNVLTVAKRPGFHRVWVSNSDGIRPAIEDYKLAGYTFVTDDAKVGDKSVNSADPIATAVSRAGGRGITLYLMEIRQEWKDADDRAEQDKVRQTEVEMFTPNKQGGEYGSAKTRARTGKGAEEHDTGE